MSLAEECCSSCRTAGCTLAFYCKQVHFLLFASWTGNIIGWMKIHLIKSFILTQLPCIIVAENYCSPGTGRFQKGSGSLECEKMSSAHEPLKAISIISVRSNMSSYHSNFQMKAAEKATVYS